MGYPVSGTNLYEKYIRFSKNIQMRKLPRECVACSPVHEWAWTCYRLHPSSSVIHIIEQDVNICNINPPFHTSEVVARKQFMLLPASIWTTIHPCPYKQTRPSLAAGHRLGNCGLGRSCVLVRKCSIVRVLQGPRILQHFTMWPIQPWFEF